MSKRSRLGDVQFTEILHHAEAWVMRGVVLRNLQRDEEAIASYDNAIEFNSLDAKVSCNRGGALYMLQRYSEAIASFDKAIQIKPDFHVAIENRKQALSQLKH